MSRKTVDLREGVVAVVEPVNEEEYEAAGAHTLIKLKVLQIETTKANIREE